MVILITGISSGFGRAMALKLSGEGHKVYGTYRNHDINRIDSVEYVKADVQNEEDVKKTVDRVVLAEGKIDVFINNAGMGIGGPIESSSLSEIQRQMDTNWMGFIRFLHYVLPVMRRKGCGKIICLSSIGGLMGLPFQGIYSASKFAIEGTAEALRFELSDTDIKVVVLQPGDFATGFTAARKSVSSKEVVESYPLYEKYLSRYENDEKNGLTPDVLAEKVSKIVKIRNPKSHYIIASPVQKLSVYLKRLLPGRLYAKIFSSYYQ